MKKLCILLLVLILSSCGSNKQALTEKPDYFARNQECYKYKAQLDKEYDGTPMFVGAVFYSPKANSCLYTTEYLNIDEDGKATFDNGLYDVFTRQIISFYFGGNKTKEERDGYDKHKETVKVYQEQ